MGNHHTTAHGTHPPPTRAPLGFAVMRVMAGATSPPLNRLLGVVAWRVEQRHQAQELPPASQAKKVVVLTAYKRSDGGRAGRHRAPACASGHTLPAAQGLTWSRGHPQRQRQQPCRHPAHGSHGHRSPCNANAVKAVKASGQGHWAASHRQRDCGSICHQAPCTVWPQESLTESSAPRNRESRPHCGHASAPPGGHPSSGASSRPS